jgi:V8-like Glu-specific endopeptidase
MSERIQALICGLAILASTPAGASVSAKSIYGQDSRQDLYEISDQRTIDLAQSTVALMKASDVTIQGSTATFGGDTFQSQMGLCSSEKFAEQKSAAFCSGSLVAPDVILTAGHCVETQFDCTQTKFVFGFALRAASDRAESTSKNDVYSCKKLIRREQTNNGADYALIQLTKTVTNRKPLAISRGAPLAAGTPLMVIGHPSGIPTKVATGVVRDFSPVGFFTSNLDTYGGNSGSAVFNAKTGEIEGVLVRGDQDFDYDDIQGCSVSSRFGEDLGRGEDVTKISAVGAIARRRR